MCAANTVIAPIIMNCRIEMEENSVFVHCIMLYWYWNDWLTITGDQRRKKILLQIVKPSPNKAIKISNICDTKTQDIMAVNSYTLNTGEARRTDLDNQNNKD